MSEDQSPEDRSPEDRSPEDLASRSSVMELPRQGRLAGVDFGTVRIGLAICDPSQSWVTPYDTYLCRNPRLDASYFQMMATREQLVGWVLGLPIHCDGNESRKSGEVRRFAEWLAELSKLPIALFDERFTTAEAKKLLRDSGLSRQKRKKSLDRLAAHLILSHFLESRDKIDRPNMPLED